VESDLQGHTLSEAINRIKNAGENGNNIKVGISFKPNTSIKVLADVIHEINMVLIMTVEPGFGGQSFMENQISKIAQVKQMSVDADCPIIIQVDGGIKESTIAQCAQAGANCFVAGSAILKEPRTAEHYQSNIRALKNVCK
jgi:ribulose-phosphate 3-epimerase